MLFRDGEKIRLEYPYIQIANVLIPLQENQAFGRKHGCLPMTHVLPYKWPLALDILKRQYDALPSQRLLAFQSQYIDKMPNMEIHLFGQVGYFTTEPKNIESILSTRLEGNCR